MGGEGKRGGREREGRDTVVDGWNTGRICRIYKSVRLGKQ